MRISPIALALASAVAVAGCGGSGSSTRTAAPAAAAATSSPAAASAPTTTTTTTSTATATGTATTSAAPTGGAGLAGAAGCRAATLALTYLGGQGATGHGELGFALRNTGQTACSTGGYPGVQFLDRAGGALPTTPVHTTSDFFGDLPLRELTVAPGQSVSFRLGVSHGGGSGAGCTTAEGVQVIAPNDTVPLHVAIPGGASECGQTTVSPVQPGDSAYR